MANPTGPRLGQPKGTGPAQGVPVGALRKIVIAVEHETFETLRNRAIRDNTSFAEQVRILIEWGLESERNNHG